MQITQTVIDYIEAHRQEAYELLLELAQIPAPSNQEEKRAQFCKDWLEKQGAQGVYMDDLSSFGPPGYSSPITRATLS